MIGRSVRIPALNLVRVLEEVHHHWEFRLGFPLAFPLGFSMVFFSENPMQNPIQNPICNTIRNPIKNFSGTSNGKLKRSSLGVHFTMFQGATGCGGGRLQATRRQWGCRIL